MRVKFVDEYVRDTMTTRNMKSMQLLLKYIIFNTF